METVDTWYKAQGSCPAGDYELASYLLFEAGVKTLEELDSRDPARTEFCFYTGSIEERKAIVARFPQYNFILSQEPAKDWDKWWHDQALLNVANLERRCCLRQHSTLQRPYQPEPIHRMISRLNRT